MGIQISAPILPPEPELSEDQRMERIEMVLERIAEALETIADRCSSPRGAADDLHQDPPGN
jgi:hypothetical protein